MAVRNDVVVLWQQSPRVVRVQAPSTEILMQDLYDTLRHIGATVEGMAEPEIVDAEGKGPIGGGLYNGLTVSLWNAQVQFEPRPGPDWVDCTIGGGNLVSWDRNRNEDPSALNISPSKSAAFVNVTREISSSATLQYIGGGEGPSAEDIADAVWDEAALDHAAEGSTGAAISDPSGLTPSQATMLMELYSLMGLDPTRPLVVDLDTKRRRVPEDGSLIDQELTLVGHTTTVRRAQ